MRFNRLDLNLLVALDALLTERSITRAAERLNLTPSAVSSALARLRDHFGDELLVQVGRKMEPTPRADSLQDAVRDVLVRIEATVESQPRFDPASSDRVFRLFCSDYTQLALGPHLMALTAQERCSARIDLLPQVSNPQRSLERGEADLLIIPRSFMSPDHPEEVLYHEQFVCAVWNGSVLAQGQLTLERYLAARHVMMQPPGYAGTTFEDNFFKRQGLTRRAAVTTYSFAALPALLCGTDHVATLHARLARVLATTWPLTLHAPPLPIDTMPQGVQWHKYRTQDPGLVWMRGLLRRAVLRMDAALGMG